MTVAPAAAEIESFRSIVASRLGLYFEDAKLDFLADVLQKRMADTGCQHFRAYSKHVSTLAVEPSEICALAEHLTVGETYFFRYVEHFQALTELVIPNLMQARSSSRRLRLLSAGCASGEEPYSLAILLRERFPELATWDVEIRALDVNARVIEKALRAHYSPWSLRETPEELRSRYLHVSGRDFRLDESVRSMVTFEVRNLVEEDPLFWREEIFDVVFCRNVIMYLTPEVTRTAIGRIARALGPGGFLFLGHAETLRAVSQEFHLRHTHGTFYYQRREVGETDLAGSSSRPLENDDWPARNSPQLMQPGDSWFTAIRRASERVADLTHGKTRVGVTSLEPPTKSKASWDRALAIELLREERFSEAIELLRTVPDHCSIDPDSQLLMAVLLTNGGKLSEAARLCEHLLTLDELNAGAHYLMALCREHAGDPAGAVRHDQTAAYLDSGFAMPHLHLGLLAKRMAELETARRELGRALSLLDREDSSRILLFGGGFTREALVQFCRAELRACGGEA